MQWTPDGENHFDGDMYVREALKEMIVEAPWGKTTEGFLMSIDARLGTALENTVPDAFADIKDNKEEKNNLKKD